MHTLNDQVFRGFFTGRYLFDSVTGFLRYASPAAAGGFGPYAVGCSNGVYVTAPTPCPAGSHADRRRRCCSTCRARAGRVRRPTPPAPRTSPTTSSSLFVQDQWQPRPNLTLNYGLRWDAQLMPETVDPATTAYARVPERPGVSLRRHDSGPVEHVPAARRRRLGRQRRTAGRSCARSAGVYYARQNMLSQVGSVTTNGLQQQTHLREHRH